MGCRYVGQWEDLGCEFLELHVILLILSSIVILAVVATDDNKIADCCRGFGADVIMTSESCRNGKSSVLFIFWFRFLNVVMAKCCRVIVLVSAYGSCYMLHVAGAERCSEALNKLGKKYDIVVNIQGDEPLIEPEIIDGIVKALQVSLLSYSHCPLRYFLCILSIFHCGLTFLDKMLDNCLVCLLVNYVLFYCHCVSVRNSPFVSLIEMCMSLFSTQKTLQNAN